MLFDVIAMLLDVIAMLFVVTGLDWPVLDIEAIGLSKSVSTVGPIDSAMRLPLALADLGAILSNTKGRQWHSVRPPPVLQD